MEIIKNKSLLFSVLIVLIIGGAVSCETGGSNRESIENENDYEMIEGEDASPSDDSDITIDSTEISQLKQLRNEGIRYKKLLDSFARVNPNISYTYIPSENGHIKTVLGEYKVEVDGTKTTEEEYNIASILHKAFQNRQQMLSFYNRIYNVEVPAAPEDGYKAFYKDLSNHLNSLTKNELENVQGLLFVQLAVEKSGEISNIKVAESINTEYRLKREIEENTIEAIKETSTSWIPARRDGQPVRSKLEIPVWFGAESEQS